MGGSLTEYAASARPHARENFRIWEKIVEYCKPTAGPIYEDCAGREFVDPGQLDVGNP